MTIHAQTLQPRRSQARDLHTTGDPQSIFGGPQRSAWSCNASCPSLFSMVKNRREMREEIKQKITSRVCACTVKGQLKCYFLI